MKVMRSFFLVLILISFVWIIPVTASESIFWDGAERIYRDYLELMERAPVNKGVLIYNNFSESIGKEMSFFDKNFCNIPHGDKFVFCRELLKMELIKENLGVSKELYESNPTEEGIIETKKLTQDAKDILQELEKVLIRNKDAPETTRRD